MKFEDQPTTKQGDVGESLIAQWFMSRGHSVLPVYQLEKQTGKGPQLFCCDRSLVAPDMVLFAADKVVWVEAKHKTVFTWHRKTERWTTGIDLRHYKEYIEVMKRTTHPVWLMFFHSSKQPSANDLRHGCPTECPTGLFGKPLSILIEEENHRSPCLDYSRSGCTGHGRTGMVYWAHESLQLLATKQEVHAAALLPNSA